MVGRLVDLLGALSPGEARRARMVWICASDEERLRDADERQLAPRGLTLAASGSPLDWREHLRDHFRRRYDIVLGFDAPETRVE